MYIYYNIFKINYNNYFITLGSVTIAPPTKFEIEVKFILTILISFVHILKSQIRNLYTLDNTSNQ